MRVRWIGAMVVSLSAFHGCGDSGTTLAKRGDGGPAAGCTKDTDCKGDRICVEGACVSPSGGSDAGSVGGSSGVGNGGRSTSTGGSNASGAGGRATGAMTGAGGGTAGADSGSPGGSANGGSANGGNAGAGAGGAPPGPQCTAQDTSNCPPAFPFGACCTRSGTCGFMYPPFGCIGGANGDAGTGAGGAGGAPTGGGLVSTACKTCRATNCSTEAAACNANATCAALATCIDNASPFSILNCLQGLTTQARTLYNALSSCATSSCTASVCPNINI